MRWETLPGVQQETAVFVAAVRAHDRALAGRGLAVWIGAEPTFTDRRSQAPEWLSEALGPTKAGYAARILERLATAAPGAVVLRTLGRQYPGEPRPRWSLGLYARRDGLMLWDGPPDPLGGPCELAPTALADFRLALAEALAREGWRTAAFDVEDPLSLRLLCRMDGERPAPDPAREPLLARPSLHAGPLPGPGAVDPLAARGAHLLCLGAVPAEPGGPPLPCLELPQLPDPARFRALLRAAAAAARTAGLPALVWRGVPPPVDHTVAWTTLTPDPGVLEVNQAPAPDVATFYAWSRTLYAEAAAAGLAPCRLHYNGVVADSGGGGQLTLGGPSPLESPFFLAPQLLGRLVRYLERHHALSYLFAPPYVGGSSQSPRPDEGVRESFAELAVALAQLARDAAPSPDFIWRSLAPFLVDPSGNAHRAELNVEKLWNPRLGARGHLGLVEFRALRMARSPERAAALAALLRAVAAMLAEADPVPELVDWGPVLHDRFALPFYLRQDLDEVLADLETAGLGLAPPLAACLRVDPARELGRVALEGCELRVEQAVEFWPLIGDTASQEAGGSRLVDASTSRLQLALRAAAGDPEALDGWELLAAGHRLPLRREQDAEGPIRLFGLRYRSFVPWVGLHPGIPAQGPIALALRHHRLPGALRITVHEWRPDGEPYPGLPADLEEARQRRQARLVVETLPSDGIETRLTPPHALTDYCLDLRRT